MASDPLTYDEVVDALIERGLVRSYEDWVGIHFFLKEWEEFRRLNPGKRFTPPLRLIYLLQHPVQRYIKMGRANNVIQRPRVQDAGSPHRCLITRILPE